jgi:hypothetical protein
MIRDMMMQYFQGLWTYIERIWQIRMTSTIAEFSCKALKHGLRCVGMNGAALLPSLATAVAMAYASTQYGSFLYLTAIMVEVFSPDLSNAGGLVDVRL